VRPCIQSPVVDDSVKNYLKQKMTKLGKIKEVFKISIE
jgi:hypothetical protein